MPPAAGTDVQLPGRKMIAGTEEAEDAGWHLEGTAWQQGVSAAPGRAIVADGTTVNCTIYRRQLGQMTGVLASTSG